METLAVDVKKQIDQSTRLRHERWTRDVIQMMMIVTLAAAVVITIGNMLGIFIYKETLPVYYIVAASLPMWFGARIGLKWMGYLPSLLCFALGVYTVSIAGYRSLGVMFFLLDIILAAMLRGSRTGFVAAGGAVCAYIGFAGARDGFSFISLQYSTIFAFTALGVALLLWYIETRFQQSLQELYESNASLQAEADRRRRAEQEQRMQEMQMRRLAENTTDMVAEIDQDGMICYASPSSQTVLGFDPQELVGKNAFELLLPEDQPAAHVVATEAVSQHKPGHIRIRALHANGSMIYLEVSGTPLYDEHNDHKGFVISSRNVSDQVRIENEIQLSEAKFRNIIESLPLGMHLYHLGEDNSLIFTGYNPAADRILGIEHQRLIGLTIEAAFPGLAEGDIPMHYRMVAATGEAWQVQHVIYDDEKIVGAFDVNAFRTTPGNMAAVFVDISERLRAEEAIRTSEEMFSTAFRTSPDSININVMKDGVYLDINLGFTQLMGYERDEVIGKSSLELNIWADPEDRARLVRGLKECGVVENLEARFRRKNGNIAVGLMSARVIVLHGEPCILSVTRDVTDRWRAELELRETHAQLERAYDATLEGWALALELRERETANHSQRVVAQTMQIAKELGIHGNALLDIQRGAMLHDIGKVGVPDSILLKPGPLTPDEWVSMRQHVEFAHAMLSGIEYLKGCMDIPCYHHEKWDGSGYPQGLRGEDIPLAARIFAVVDVFDALTHDRPYRPAWGLSETRRYLREQSGKHFDPEIVDLFLRLQGAGSLL